MPNFGGTAFDISVGGRPGAQAFLGQDGLGARSNGENPGLSRQAFGGTEFFGIAIDPSSRFKEAYGVKIAIGRAVTPGNRGEVTVTLFDGDSVVGTETFVLPNGSDRTIGIESDVGFTGLQVEAASGNRISFTVKSASLGLESELLI